MIELCLLMQAQSQETLFYLMCWWYNSLRVRNEITKCALNKPRFSAWRRLYKYGDNSSFISMTGFDRKSFQLLLDLIFPHIGGKRRGRPEALNDLDKVG